MNKLLLAGLLGTASLPALALECADAGWLAKGCQRVVSTYENGRNEVMVSGYAYHFRNTYSEEKLKELNEEAYGGGLGRYVEDEDGDLHNVYGLVFKDSHKKAQMMLGYGYQTYAGSGDFKAGIGFTAFLVSRPDIYHSLPIPGILPMASLRYKQAALMFSFVPKLSQGTTGNGNVLFAFTRFGF